MISFQIIKIKAVHQHPSNNLIFYTYTHEDADTLKDLVEQWLPNISPGLTYKPKLHHMVVHGMPTTFDPNNPEDIEDLMAMNTCPLTAKPLWIRWMNPDTHMSQAYGSLILAMPDPKSAAMAIEHQIFWKGRNKRMEAHHLPKP
ncbi:hypothetical protein CROQUDRAFT_100312 [Cronartium quercuum f. sp. fusiforme G11]|uniref:Uncharacterized protein n=1 Tax=Cronartium quercuum f. sp. fusiforme G11 TaxID=708437 RepID=A0A9P6NA84_9BASI|nr:hypothetical protein CROQUDRAFT_100312 [Cronartium quercuum f. sp. fusiforme G11]